MQKLKVYKTNLGLFLKSDYTFKREAKHVKLNGSFIGDLVHSVNNDHLFLKDVHEITKVEFLKSGNTVLVGYVLKIAAVANEEIPLKLSLEDVRQGYDEDDDEWIWLNKSDIRDLYKEDRVKTEDTWTDQEFEVEVMREFHIENYEEPVKTVVTKAENTIDKLPYGSSNILSHVVQYSDFERILTPEILLHERPCSLSAGQVFQIVRQYIKENINIKAARITSDYDWGITVKRVIKVKPYSVRSEEKKANGRSYATPRYRSTNVVERLEDVFSLAPKVYNGYTVAEQWNADNLKDMAEQVRVYLEELMQTINTPLKDCPHCSGCGVIKGE